MYFAVYLFQKEKGLTIKNSVIEAHPLDVLVELQKKKEKDTLAVKVIFWSKLEEDLDEKRIEDWQRACG